MVKYSLEIKQSAQKELDALDDTLFTRIAHRTRRASSGNVKMLPPSSVVRVFMERPEDSCAGRQSPALRMQKLTGYKDQWRVRVGNWRVLYIIDDAAKLVYVMRIAHRREGYE